MPVASNAAEQLIAELDPALAAIFGASVLLVLGSVVGMTLFAVRARKAARQARDALLLIRMSETAGKLGYWEYDVERGTHVWSPGLFRLLGLEPGEPLLPGDADTMMVDGGVGFRDQVEEHRTESAPYEIALEMCRVDGALRHIRLNACNRLSPSGYLERVFGVVRDVTDEVTKVRRLDEERQEAVKQAEQAEELASTDALTGLANRRRAMATIDRAVLHAALSYRPLGLIAFDIDHFKAVNDTYGHQAGDAVLKRIAEIVRAQARNGDLVARMGGEEFLWLMPGAGREVLENAAERLRSAIEAGSSAGGVPAVTVSIGFAERQDGDTALKLYARADAALYDAKASGRNIIRMAA